jgi:hypothetical protein
MPNKGIFEKTSLSESKNYESDTENRAGCQEQEWQFYGNRILFLHTLGWGVFSVSGMAKKLMAG